jgi:hypothetical protein
MTVLYVAATRREVSLLVDSGGGPVPSGKVAYIAPGGLVLARSGDPGHIAVFDELRRMLELGLLPQDVRDPEIPKMLRHLHATYMSERGARFVLAQMLGGQALAMSFESRRGFEPHHYTPGAWVCRFDETAEAGSEPAPATTRQPIELPRPPRLAASVAVIVRDAIKAARDYPDKAAGPFTWCHVSQFGVRFEPAAIGEA